MKLVYLFLGGCAFTDAPDHEPYCGASFDCGDGISDDDGDGYCGDRDCDDADCDIHPGNDAVCDGKDNDCDMLIDGEDNSLGEDEDHPREMSKFYLDMDQDRQCSEEYVEDCTDYAMERLYISSSQAFTWKGESYMACGDVGYWNSETNYDYLITAGYTEGAMEFFDCCDDGTERACDGSPRPECYQTDAQYVGADEYESVCVNTCDAN